MSRPTFPGRLNHEDPDLSDRHRQVFSELVALHGRSARPVGSETLAQQGGLRLSPASIRSALAELESWGLVERLHASAGSVPSARGYELYVRHLLQPALLPPSLSEEVAGRLVHSVREVEDLLNEASRLLSSLSRQLGLAVTASLERETLSRIELASLGEHRALMVLGLGGGAVHTLVLELESPLDADALEEVAEVLWERLVDRSLAEVRQRLAEDPELVRRSAVRIVALAAARSWRHPVPAPFFTAGAMHIAEQPEFASGVVLGPLLRAVEAGTPLDHLMISGVEGQVAFRVGVDEDQALAGCSLVSYALPGPVRGAVGVLGPLRMDYSHAFAVVEAVGSRVAELLQG